MAFPLLPPLKNDGHGLTTLSETGTWVQLYDVDLNNIAENLAVTKIDGKFIDIDSIPNMWARPLLFEIALYDEEHPMHECVVGEWRGILAMLALKERRKFLLETPLMTIPDGDSGNTPEFLQALHRLLPQRTLDDAGTTWDKLYLILFKGKPIGMTSPTTLVFTSIDYINHITVNDVPWYDPPFLCDPISHLDADEKTSLAGWLNDYYTKTIIPLPSSPTKENLAPRMLDFIKDLGEAPDEQPKLADTPLGMSLGIFTGMNFPIAPKEYFTEKLFVISRADAFLKQNVLLPTGSDTLKIGENSVTPILPIAKQLLNDFRADELSKRITFETTPVGIEVSLQLPSSNGGPDFSVSRVYVNQTDGDAPIFDKHEIVEIPNLPVLEIWPNFRTPDWEAYYTYFNGKGQDTFYAVPFHTDGVPDDVKITKTSAFPKMMICKYKNEDAGFLSIKAPPVTVPDVAKTWNVGIDFGTTSTTVYKIERPDGAAPESVALRDRLLQITDSQDLRATVQDHFLADRDAKMPLFSLFHDKKPLLLDGGIKPLVEGRIYFVDVSKEFNENRENIVSNLKWSDDPVDRKRTQAYLEQICLQCAAEAAANNVSKINWHFSYPIAFSQENTAQFKTICTHATADYRKEGTIYFESESVATAKFFANEFGGFGPGAVCIDIGGETSDISVWQGNTLYWQTSIRFAGRHIFLDLFNLFNHLPFWSDFLAATYHEKDIWIDKKINNSEQSLQNIFALYGGQIQNTPFVALIALGVSGLFYYVGLILNYLNTYKDFGTTMPHVYIGGNGSRILHWLANGEFKPGSDSCRDLKDVLRIASGFDPESPFNLKITPKPKHEAAAGLIDDQAILELNGEQFDILAGEVFTENGGICAWTEPLTTDRFGNRLRSENKPDESMQIEKFIGEFNRGLGKRLANSINLDKVTKKELTDHLDDWFANLAKKPAKDRIVEPIFINLLRKLLYQLNDGNDNVEDF